jgi:ribose 5-phosphate isomerase B
MKIAIGSDHAGFELKEVLKKHLVKKGFDVDDKGTDSTQSVDYPDFARKVAHDVAAQNADYGVLVCGSGIGMAITANKVVGIRAANVSTELEAQLSREHNDANIVAIGARIVKEGPAIEIVDRFLGTAFAHGRHDLRIAKITKIEKEECKAAR